MIINFWNKLRGYVCVRVSGFSVERFINLAVHKGIYIWDVKYYESYVTLCVSVKAFKMLKSCAQKTRCRLKIIKKEGLPFFLFKYRKRKILLGGFAFFVFILYFFSMFVWLVDISGTKSTDPQAILTFLNDEKLKVGAFKYNVNTKDLETKILKNFKDISWINIYIKGTKATISVREAIPKEVIVDRKTPCNIVATKDALISSVATSSGTALVKKDDVVYRGDLLIKGEVVVKNDETGIIKEEVHAKGDVVGKIYYDINFFLPFEYIEKQYTQKIKNHYSLMIFDKAIEQPFFKVDFQSFDKNVSRTQLNFGENYPLPIVLVKTAYKEFTPTKKTYEPETCKELANRMITGRIIREFDFSADIIEKKIDFVENDDGLVVKSVITTLENIGEEKLIEPANENGNTQ